MRKKIRTTTTMATALSEGSCADSITAAEIQRLGKALQNQEFRDLLLEYAQEISDPTNKAQYEAEVIAIERERGYNVTFLCPEPHYVFKTTVSFKGTTDVQANKKAFINVCISEAIEKPSCKRVSPAIARSFYNQESGLLWTVPHSITYPRDDTDKQRSKCVVYDCVYHPDTLRLAGSNKHFKKMVEEIAMDAVENSFGIQLDRTHLKYPKIKFKGTPAVTILRKKIEPDVKSNECTIAKDQPADATKSETNSAGIQTEGVPMDLPKSTTPVDPRVSAVVPEYVIKHRYQSSLQDHAIVPAQAERRLPSALVVEIKLPTIDSISCVSLDVLPEKLALVSLPGIMPNYALDISLPYVVDDAGGQAMFCTEMRVLTVELPVLKSKQGLAGDVTTQCSPASSASEVSPTQDESESLSKQMSEMEISKKQEEFRTDGGVEPGPADVKFVLPEFSCHQSNDELVFVFKAKNVEKKSVRVERRENGVKCLLTFASIGGGACPFHYSLFLRFSAECRIAEGIEQVSVTDENAVIILAKHLDSQHYWEEFDYSVDEHGEVIKEIFTLNALQRKLHVLQADAMANAETLKSATENPQTVRITEVSSERFTFEIDELDARKACSLPNLPNGNPPTNEEPESKESAVSLHNPASQTANGVQDANTKQDVSKDDPTDNVKSTSFQTGINANGFRPVIRPMRKFRSVSESCDDRNPVHPRGILKMHHRSRHLSESSDDACWSSQEHPTAMDSDIPEEGSLENLFQVRKSVHFNEKIYRNFFRSNSSILGQRKKNQRKESKRRESLKRSSESECSEAETDNIVQSRSPPNKNQLNANRNQKQQVRTTGNWDCQTAYELFYQREANGNESTNLRVLDNRKSEETNRNGEDAKDNGRTKKSKSRRRKKRFARRNSDGEGNSSSDGQQNSYDQLRDGVRTMQKINYIESY